MSNITKPRKIIKHIFFIYFFLIHTSAFCALHDPTQPPGMSGLLDQTLNPGSMYNLHIDAIFLGHNKKISIINGQRVSVGDKIFNIDVVDIYKNSVRLKDENGEFIISMINSVTKTPAKNTMRKT